MARKLLKQGFLYHKLRKTFGKFYNRHFDLVKQFNSSLINLIEWVYRIHIYMGISSKKIKKVQYITNGITLQNAVSLIAQDFLNKIYDKNI